MGKNFFRKILVAVNGSQSSIHAAMYAVMMARTYNTALKSVYVVDSATIKYLAMNRFLVNDEKEDFEQKLREDGKHYLSYVEMLASSKGVKMEKELRSGGVFTEIIKVADEYSADLILLGGNEREPGRSDVKRNVLSSAQSEVLANSKCPVLIVQKPKIEELFKIF